MSQLKRKQLKTDPHRLKPYFKNNEAIINLIDKFGIIERIVYQDPFVVLVDTIVSQQITTKTKDKIMHQLEVSLGAFDAHTIAQCNVATLQSFGIAKQKVMTIKNIAQDVVSGDLDLEGLKEVDSSMIVEQLIAYKGIGIWTCEMMLLFAYEKEDILSYHDYGIRKGIEILIGHHPLTKAMYQQFSDEITPYQSQISFYLWALAQTN
ncbi:MAG TPA: hypothetical protein VIG45_07195 [Erysipelothrix sp.]